MVHLGGHGGIASGRGAQGCMRGLIVNQVWDTLADAWQKKCDRVGLSRWFAFAKGIRQFMPLWHKRAVGTTYLVLNEGMFKGKSPAELVKLKISAAPVPGEDIASERTGAGPTLKMLRAATQNTLHLVATVLMDEHMYHIGRLLSCVLQPVQEAHSKQRASCRSSKTRGLGLGLSAGTSWGGVL